MRTVSREAPTILGDSEPGNWRGGSMKRGARSRVEVVQQQVCGRGDVAEDRVAAGKTAAATDQSPSTSGTLGIRLET